MKKLSLWLAAALCLAGGGPLRAAEGRIVKVIPLLLDLQGHTAVSPSLFDRDAYQAALRKKPAECAGMVFNTQVRLRGKATGVLTVKLEARGGSAADGKSFHAEKAVGKRGLFETWVAVPIGKEEWTQLKGLSSWRVTLWEGDKMIGEQKSFLW